MWLKQAIEKQHLNYLQEFYSRADRRVMLRDGMQTYPSYTNPNNYHLVGYVQKAYSLNGKTFLEISNSKNEVFTITVYEDIRAESIEYASVLCRDIKEYSNHILDNTIFERTCSQVEIL